MTSASPTRTLPRAAAFWLVGATLVAFMFAAGAPSPLYVVYQARWGFSAGTLTTVFAVYAIALLLALVTVGALSDHLGRRPVLLAALLIDIAAMVVFVFARDVGWLLVARAVQGVATGAATGTISAYLIDLQPARDPRLGALVNSTSPTLGLAFGALGSGVLVQYAPAPTTLVFLVLIVVFAADVVAVALMPETVVRRTGALASLRPRAGVPRRIRPQFLIAAPALVATWALGGLYLSLGPSLASGILGRHNHLVGGLVVFALTGAGATGSALLRDRVPRQVMIGGSLVLALGVVVTLVALGTVSTPVFFVGTVIAGFGFGAAFLGAFRSLAGLARPDERAELFAAVYLVSYVAFSIPAIVAGIAVTDLGLTRTATIYGIVVMVLAVAAAIGLLARRPTPRPPAAAKTFAAYQS
jgi:predicted MFS family arabinose efflux permease